MDNINLVVAERLKEIREQRKLSLDALAAMTGVSKSMLGRIERGEVSPTISTVWKITNGLKISFTELTNRTEQEYEVIDIAALQPLLEDGGKYRNYPLFGFDSNRRFEVIYLELDPGAELNAEAHPEGTQEFVTVFSGALTVRTGQDTVEVPAPGSIRFRADRPHGYRNSSRELCRLSMVIYYP